MHLKQELDYDYGENELETSQDESQQSLSYEPENAQHEPNQSPLWPNSFLENSTDQNAAEQG